MDVFFEYGTMYAKVEKEEHIKPASVQLGMYLIMPGDLISKIGTKDRSSFEMQKGHFLKYIGMIDKTLLFKTQAHDESKYYYAFSYVDHEILIVGGHKGCRDIKVDELIIA